MKPSNFVVTTFTTQAMILEIKDWCHAHFGHQWDPVSIDRGGSWTVVWEGPTVHYGTGYRWAFVCAKNAEFFALRWA